MTDVFISYSRKDKAFVQQLARILSTPRPKGAGMDIWVDWEDIPPTSNWLNEIYSGIESADNFVFIISPDSIASEVCGWELAHAVKHNKRIVPVVYRDVPSAPSELGAINYIFLRDLKQDREALHKLVTALRTDLAWVKMHTRLEIRAVEWEKNHRDASFCLQGKDLDQAERWLQSAEGKKPVVTSLQSQYIAASQRNRIRRRRLTLGASAIAGVVVIILASLFLLQTQLTSTEAEQKQNAQLTAESESIQRATQQSIAAEQSRLALARQLAQDSVQLQSQQYDLALLLAAASYQIEPSPDARLNLSNILQFSPYLQTFLRGHTAPITALAFDRGNTNHMVSGDASGAIHFWDLAHHAEFAPPLTEHTAPIIGMILLPTQLISADQTGHIFAWDLETRKPRFSITTPNLLAINASVPLEGPSITITYAYCVTGDTGCSAVKVDMADFITGEIVNSTTIPIYAGIVAISPDGYSVAVGAPLYIFDQPAIAIFNAYDGSQIQTLTGHADYPAIYSLAYDSTGRYLASGSCSHGIWGAASNPDSCQTGEGLLWSLDSGQIVGQSTGLGNYITHIAANPPLNYDYYFSTWGTQGQSIAMTTGEDRDIQLGYDDAGGIGAMSDVLTLTGHVLSVTTFAYIPQNDYTYSPTQNSYLVSGAEDGTLAVWDLLTNPPFGHEFLTTSEIYYRLNFSADGSMLAFPYTDDQYWIVDTQTNQILNQFYGVEVLAFSPDNQTIAVMDQNHNVLLHNIFDSIEIPQLQAPTSYNNSQMIFSPDGRLFAVDEGVGAVNLFTVKGQNLEWTRSLLYEGELKQMQFTADSAHFVTTACLPESSCSQQRLIVSDLVQPNDLRIDANVVFSLTPDNQFALIKDSQGVALIRADETQDIVQRFESLVFALCSPDGRYIAGYDSEGYIYVYDLNTAALLWKSSDFRVSDYDPAPLIFDASGSWIASGSFVGNIHIWDTLSGVELYRFDERFVDPDISVLEDFMRTMTFSPQGNKLAAIGHGKLNGVILWDFDLIQRACQVANRDLTPAERTQYGLPDDTPTCPQVASS